MSILIKGMKMPRDCVECRFFEVSDEYCYARGAYGSEWGKSTGCPLAEDDINHALSVIKKYCESHGDCTGCRFKLSLHTEEMYCELNLLLPADWKGEEDGNHKGL